MTVATQPRHSLRLRGRSFLALVLAPEPPVPDWLGQLDEWLSRSPGFFTGRAVVLDLNAVTLDKEGVAKLIGDLSSRGVRLMGVEGTKPSYLELGMPPLVSGGREAEGEVVEPPPVQQASPAEAPASGKAAAEAAPASAPAGGPAPPPLRKERARSLLIDTPVRSGQTVSFPQGDVTIIGSVASGAEVVAGGSIHVYGALRGRAIAGSTGSAHARIFCGKLEAELLAIDGLYRTADDMEARFRGRPVQTWLDGNEMMMAALS